MVRHQLVSDVMNMIMIPCIVINFIHCDGFVVFCCFDLVTEVFVVC